MCAELVCAADDPRWLDERRKGITATDITAIIGLSPYESAYSLYFKKRGDIPDEHTDNDRLRLGRELEPYILDRWVESMGWEECVVASHEPLLYRSSDRPWQLATPDRIPLDTHGAKTSVVEVKSWADADRARWADGPPARVRAQVLWQMDTLDVATGHVGVLFLPSGEFRSYIVEHSRGPEQVDCSGCAGACQVCEDIYLLREAGRDFMDRLDSNQPPSPDASSATLAALKARFADPLPGKEAEIDAELWDQFSYHAEEIAAAEVEKRYCEARIREQAGEAKYLTVNGTRVATRVTDTAQVKAHERHTDYIRRIPSKGETDGA